MAENPEELSGELDQDYFDSKLDELEERIEDFLILEQEYDEHPTTNPIDDDWLKAIVVDPERGVPDPLRTHLLRMVGQYRGVPDIARQVFTIEHPRRWTSAWRCYGS